MNNDREFTWRAVVIGVILSLAMAAANMYLGLKVGITISANIPCSVIALILFHALMRTRSIAEVNLAQATGSVGEGMAAGVVFVFPALVLSGAVKPFASWGISEYVSVTLAVLAGSILGIVLTGFLRRPMVVESKELKYPEGVATAEILKTGMAAFGEGRREGIRSVIAAFCGGFAVKVFSSGVAVLQETVSGAFRWGNAAFRLGSDVSAALVGVGFIIEFNGAVLVALGGALAWVLLIPLFTALHPAAGAPDAVASAVWANQVRYIGVGGMAVGGLWSIIQIRRQLAAGIHSALAGFKGADHSAQSSREPQNFDLRQGTIWIFIAVGILISAAVYFFNVGPLGASIATLYTILAVFFFVAISVYIVGLIGSTNQPVSGITICTFLLAALFLFVGRVGGAEAVRTILFISGVVCLAACLSGTASQNFKTGLIVGSTPRALQSGLIIAVVVTSLLAAPLMAFLDKAFGIGTGKLLAPQASMFSAMANGLFMEGSSLPWNMIGIGAALSIVLILLGAYLKKRGSEFGISPMAVAVGIYLPFTTTLPILLGGIVHLLITKKYQSRQKLEMAIQAGTVFCAGLVAGEALTGIFLAIPIGMDVRLPWTLIQSEPIRDILSILVLIGLPWAIYRSIVKQTAEGSR
ncbi:MAG TPA: oligopeptide transporter, OPT family [Acidobacteriota bacterium]|nr:oligopeptide transporter, OPT family [Acidobacteriota bacterium]